MSTKHLQTCMSSSIVDYIIDEMKKDNRKDVIKQVCIDPVLDHVLMRIKPYILYTAVIFATTIVLLLVCIFYIIMSNKHIRIIQ